MDAKKLAGQILKEVGGKENIKEIDRKSVV